MSNNIIYKCDSEGNMVTIPPIKEFCKVLEMKFKMQEEEVAYWKTKYTNIISGNKEYQSLLNEKKEIEERLYNGFGIFNSEKEAIDKWYKEHKQTHLTPHLTYKFTPLGIGTVGEIECSCGECFKFRDID